MYPSKQDRAGSSKQGRAGVLKKTTNEQRLMGPMRSERWLNINIFFQKLLARGGGEVTNFFPIYQTFFGHIVNFPEILNFLWAYRNFSVQHTKILP